MTALGGDYFEATFMRLLAICGAFLGALSGCGGSNSALKDFGPLDPCKYEPAALIVHYHGQSEEHVFEPPYGRGRCAMVVLDVNDLPLVGGVDVWMMPAPGSILSYYAYGRRLGDFEWQPIPALVDSERFLMDPGLNRFVRYYGQQYATGRLVVGAFASGRAMAITIRVAPGGMVGGH